MPVDRRYSNLSTVERPTATWSRCCAVGFALVALSALEAADEWLPGANLQLETHGYASFGYPDTWGNNWLGTTRDGTTQFWEAAANVIARPMDRLRIGASATPEIWSTTITAKCCSTGHTPITASPIGSASRLGASLFPIGLYNT